MAQTAVEFLQEKYNSRQVYEESIFDEEFEQAKAMEKEQIEDAYNRGKKEHNVSSKPISKTWGFLGEEENNNNERRNRSW